MKISEAYLRYISEYLEIKGVDINQITHYKASARLWTEIVGDRPLNRLTMADIAKYTQGLKTYARHTLRHSFATNFISNNGNIRYLALLMGHNSIQTTARYTHIVDNDLKREYLAHHTC